jgi:hypothetical protein
LEAGLRGPGIVRGPFHGRPDGPDVSIFVPINLQGENIMLKYALAASAAVAAVMALSAPVYANNTTASITVNGTVGAKCNMALTTQTVSLPGDPTGDDGKLNPAAFNFNPLAGGGEFWCNGAGSTLTLNATPFSNAGYTGAAPSGFTKVVNYTLSGTLGAANVTYDTATDSGDQTSTVGIFDTTNPSGHLQADANDNRLIAGDYSATVTLTLTPGT